MLNKKPTKELFDAVSNHYTATSRVTSTTGRIENVLKKNDTQPIVTTLLNWSSEITSRKSLSDVLSSLNGIRQKVEDEEVRAALEEVASQVQLFKEALPLELEDLKVLSKSSVDEYLSGLETAAQRALSFLAVRAGLTATDILREVNQLSQVRNGRVEVGPRTSPKMPNARVINFDPTFLNEVLDPNGEVIEVIANYKVRPNCVGLDGLARIGEHTQRLPFTMTQLRTSHAIHLLQDGMPWEEVAAIQGVSKTALRNRVVKYLEANNIAF